MWWARTETPAPPLRTFTIPYPQDAPMAVYCCATSLAIAPDDSYLLFGAISGRSLSVGALRFYIHRFDTGETRSVDWATRGYMPTISPDSREFAYVELPAPDAETRVAADFRLVRIALAGGAPFDLGISSPAPPSWGKDNNIYLGSRSADQSVITRLPGVGGEPETLVPTDLGDGVTIGRVAPFPERGFVLFERHHDAAVGIGVLDLDTMRARELVPEGRDPRLTSTGHLLWHRDGVVYAAPLSDDGGSLAGSPVPVLQGILLGVQQSAQFAVSEAGTLARVYGERSRDRTYSLLSIDASGNTQVESSIVSQFADVRLSPDGGRIAFTRGTIGADSRGDIWVHDLARDATAPLTTDGASFGHVWSHDGEWIYYQRRSDADPGDVWRLRADGGGEAEPVLELPGAQRPVSMSQDGRTLLYGNNVSALLYGTLGLLSLDDREATELSGIADVQNPRLSPDGRLVAYQSRESGIDQVYVVDLAAGGARHPISSGRGAATRPVWAPDGSALLFFTETGPRTLYRVSFSRTDGGALQISAPERELTGEDTWQLQDIFPDGRILVSDPQLPGDGTVQRDEIRVTLNWFQELERLSPRDGAR
jgi:Tol biopolymer transport system component